MAILSDFYIVDSIFLVTFAEIVFINALGSLLVQNYYLLFSKIRVAKQYIALIATNAESTSSFSS